MIRFTIISLFIIFSPKYYGQPDSRFRAFDWTLYKGGSSVNSLSEGYNYLYIGTKTGGLKRFNTFGNRFDEPITTAQGLKGNSINATHFDQETGLIWVATKHFLQYSFSREGDWYDISMDNLGLSKRDRIEQIGSSSSYLWLKARSTYYKLDHSSGVLIGIYPVPDELSIKWSSGTFMSNQKSSNILLNYPIMDGYVFNGDELVDNLGRRVKIKTFYFGKHGNIYFGTNDGLLFHATNTMQVFSSYNPDIKNIEVSSLASNGNKLWVGSTDFINSKGISILDLQNYDSRFYDFESTINMTPTSISSLCFIDEELWVGGEDILLYYNTKKDFWRTLTEGSIGYTSKIYDIFLDSSYAWIGSSSGISCIDRITKNKVRFGIENLFKNIPVYVLQGVDDEIWIGSHSGVYILSLNNPQIRKSNEMGKINFSEPMRKITAIDFFGNKVYLAGDMGIFSFDRDINEWDLEVPSSFYNDKEIQTLVANTNYIFLGSDNGLIRIDKRSGFISKYTFKFIGEVNDLFIDDNILWIGSTEGLIKFKWKRDT